MPKKVMSTGVPTALIYTRVSMDEMAREGLSLPAQLAESRRYAAGRGWLLGNEYRDVLTGKRDDRPDYQRLLSDVRTARAAGEPVVVVVAALDRFGRRLKERVERREELKSLNVPVHSVREGGEVSDLTANILGSVAEEEVRRLGERVSYVIRNVTATGWYFPGKVPWGYRLREAAPDERKAGSPRSVLDVDEGCASYVRQAFGMATMARSSFAVARWAQGLPASDRGGRRFGPGAMRKLLANPVYAARPRSGDSDVLARPVARWPALVDDDTFRRVQERLADHTRLPHQSTNRYLLTGLLRCQRCGLRMSGCGSPNQLPRYRCRSHMYGANAPVPSCNETALVQAIDDAVLAEVGPLLDIVADAKPAIRLSLRRAWQRLVQSQHADDTGPRIAHLERSADKQRERLRKAACMLVDGEIDRDGYELLRDGARAELGAIEAQLADFRSHAPQQVTPDLEAALAEVGGWQEALRSSDRGEQRAALAELVERIEPVRLAYNTYEARIVWTPTGAALVAVFEAVRATAAA